MTAMPDEAGFDPPRLRRLGSVAELTSAKGGPKFDATIGVSSRGHGGGHGDDDDDDDAVEVFGV